MVKIWNAAKHGSLRRYIPHTSYILSLHTHIVYSVYVLSAAMGQVFSPTIDPTSKSTVMAWHGDDSNGDKEE